MRKGCKIVALIMAVVLMLSACAIKTEVTNADTTSFNTNYKYVFVHGLSGWGSYDKQNKYIKYWGMMTGDLLKFLNNEGFDCYAASVNPQGSAWDRACELYAQLTGSVVDYGKEHSERCNHDRFGTDFSENPLIDTWSKDDKINLLGHSFGGATIRMLSTLMAEGSKAEMEATDESEISPLFTGGKGDWIYSMTALAAPHNGTSAYEANDDEVEDISFKQKIMSDMVSSQTAMDTDGRVDYDYAAYDLRIDNAIKLNDTLKSYENIYYFSIPCSSTVQNADGTYSPNEDITEAMFVKSAIKLGKHTSTTEGGYIITEQWYNNDGLVNTISATAPFNAESKPLDENEIEKGVWQVYPVYEGDHMSLQGDIFLRNDVRQLYIDLLSMINGLEE